MKRIVIRLPLDYESSLLLYGGYTAALDYIRQFPDSRAAWEQCADPDCMLFWIELAFKNRKVPVHLQRTIQYRLLSEYKLPDGLTALDHTRPEHRQHFTALQRYVQYRIGSGNKLGGTGGFPLFSRTRPKAIFIRLYAEALCSFFSRVTRTVAGLEHLSYRIRDELTVAPEMWPATRAKDRNEIGQFVCQIIREQVEVEWT